MKARLERGNFLWTRSACCRDGEGNAGEYREVERGSLGNGVHLSARDIETRSSQRGEVKEVVRIRWEAREEREREREGGIEKWRKKKKGRYCCGDRATWLIWSVHGHETNRWNRYSRCEREIVLNNFHAKSTKSCLLVPIELSTCLIHCTGKSCHRRIIYNSPRGQSCVVRGFTGSFRDYPLAFARVYLLYISFNFLRLIWQVSTCEKPLNEAAVTRRTSWVYQNRRILCKLFLTKNARQECDTNSDLQHTTTFPGLTFTEKKKTVTEQPSSLLSNINHSP